MTALEILREGYGSCLNEVIKPITAEQILCFDGDMNILPRRTLGYASPEELFNMFLNQIYSLD